MAILSHRDCLLVVLGLFVSKGFDSLLTCREIRLKHDIVSLTSPLTSKDKVISVMKKVWQDQSAAAFLTVIVMLLVVALISLFDTAAENNQNESIACIHVLLQCLDLFILSRLLGHQNSLWNFANIKTYRVQDIVFLTMCSWLGLHVFWLLLSFICMLVGFSYEDHSFSIGHEFCDACRNHKLIDLFISWDWSFAMIQGYMSLRNISIYGTKKEEHDELQVSSASNSQMYILLSLGKAVIGSNSFWHSPHISSTLTYYTISSLVVSYVMITKEFSPIDTLLKKISAIKVCECFSF